MICSCCHEGHVEQNELGFTLFMHFGFVNLKKNCVTGRCLRCWLLFNILDAGETERLDCLFRTPH